MREQAQDFCSTVEQAAQDADDFIGKPLEYPLSYGQTRLWFLDKLAAGNPYYNLPLAVRLPAQTNHHAFALALNEVVRRHDSLRSCIRERDGEPISVVMPFEPFALPFSDLSHLSQTDCAERVAEITAKNAGRAFDLAQAPLVRFELIKSPGKTYLFLATMHHIVSDGWSMGVFWDELTTLYSDAIASRSPQLPEPELQYGDYAAWQREELEGDALVAQRDYWRTRLKSMEQLDLPTDFRRPSVQEHRGAIYEFSIPAGLTKHVTEAAQRCSTTTFAVLLAGLAVLLGRYAGQTDVVLGTPRSNRDREELEQMIGFFVNSLVLRIDLSGNPDFDEVIRRTGHTIGEALARSDYPFERLVEDMCVPRDTSRNPIFQVTSQFFAGPKQQTAQNGSAPDQSGGMVAIEKGTAVFDMTWNFWAQAQSIRGQIEFDSDLFDPRRVKAMAEAYQTLMTAALAAPDTPVDRLPLVRADNAIEFSPDTSPELDATDLWSRIRAQAMAQNDQIVIEADDVTLTGTDLIAQVEALAAGLQAQGIGAEDVVAIDMERSERLVLAVLGVLAAGAAFIPLASQDPSARKAAILKQTGCRLTIIDTGTAPLDDGATAPFDTLTASGATYVPSPPCTDDQLAYVITTSGSTGTPKPVAQTHGAIARQIDWLSHRLSPSDRDAILLKTPLVFDASLWELFLPLATGARLVVGAPDVQRDPKQIVRTLAAHKITIAQFVPSMLRLVLDDIAITECTHLKAICAGGEAMSEALAACVQEALPACRVFNLYGPAETCVQSAIGFVPAHAEDLSPALSESVGGHRVYLLGPQLEPLPLGHPGELWIGGVGVARGYLGAPGMTADRFLPDPFAGGGARMYRTGDRFCQDADGRLKFIGRADAQIKRSGVRIERGEIEAAALDHPEVRRAAAIEKNGALVVFAETDCASSDLGRHMGTRLPKLLMPDAIVPIPCMPTLVSGKADLRALQDFDAAPPVVSEAAPRSKIDEAVAMIWAEVLDRETVQIDQDFFADLGGHSLLAIRAVVSMREILGIELQLHLIFDHATVESLVDALWNDGATAERLASVEQALMG